MATESGRRRPSFRRSLSRSISSVSQAFRRLSSQLSNRSTNEEEKDTDELVSQVKFKFYREYANKKDLFDYNDIQLTFERPDIKYVQRFLERQKMDVNKALEQIVKTLKWRKEEGLSQVTDATFPRTLHQLSVIFRYEPDLEGNSVVHVRIKLYQPCHPYVTDVGQKFLVHNVYLADQIGAKNGAGWIMVADISGISMKQCDISFLNFLLKIYLNYCPNGFRRVIMVNAPWYAKPLFKAALSILPGNLEVHMISKGELTKFIAKENLPPYLGGTCRKDPRIYPDGCPTIEDYIAENYPARKDVHVAIEKYKKLASQVDW